MATQLQIRRGTTAQMGAFTGAEGELAVNTSTDTVHVHDGATAGGFALAKADGSNIGTYAGSFTTISASGAITANGGIALGDSDKATFGASDDLQIYHDGSNSFISDQGTGHLKLLAGDFRLNNAADDAQFISAVNGAEVNLFHNNALKLSTTSTGIDVTGTATIDGGATENTVLTLDSGTANTYLKITDSNSTNGTFIGATTNDLNFYPNNSLAVTMAASGNVGIGVTPENHYTGYTAVDFGVSSSIFGNTTTADTNALGIANNAYLNSGATNWIYKETDEATRYTQSSGTHVWHYAASGTAGNAITWSEAMRIDLSGNFIVGSTNPAPVSNNVVGVSIRNFGEVQMSTNNQGPLYLNRKGTDGALVTLRKENVDVGSIGTLDGNSIYIGNGDVNLRMIDVTDDIRPVTSAGTNRDAAVDLGDANARFKDLYLSGKAYMTGLEPGQVTITSGSYFIGNTSSGYRFNNAADTTNLMILKDNGNLLVGGTAAGTVSGNDAMITVRRDSGNAGISYQAAGAATDHWETYAAQNARFTIENTSTSNGAYLQHSSSSGWTNISDERWKTDWTSLDDASSKIAALSVGKYHMLDDAKESIEGAKWDYGVKAQELLEVIPDAVDVPENPEDKYGVVPNIVFWHAVKAIQEQQATIEALTQRIQTLENT